MDKKNLMEIINVSKAFKDHKVLLDFSQEFQCGMYALMGESGIGKTTLLRMIAGLETPDKGEIRVDRTKLRMLFQEDRLVSEFQAYTNLKLLNPKLNKQDALQAMKCIGIDDADKKDIYDIPVSQYSGGMRRRVSLLSVILSGADILLLDEPFYGLDLDTKCKTMDYVKAQAKDRLLIFTTHDEFDVEYLGAKTLIL